MTQEISNVCPLTKSAHVWGCKRTAKYIIPKPLSPTQSTSYQLHYVSYSPRYVTVQLTCGAATPVQYAHLAGTLVGCSTLHRKANQITIRLTQVQNFV